MKNLTLAFALIAMIGAYSENADAFTRTVSCSKTVKCYYGEPDECSEMQQEVVDNCLISVADKCWERYSGVITGTTQTNSIVDWDDAWVKIQIVIRGTCEDRP